MNLNEAKEVCKDPRKEGGRICIRIYIGNLKPLTRIHVR